MSAYLSSVKLALGITGDYQDDTLEEYIAEVEAYILDAGVDSGNITNGLIARGVTDLWNYDGNAKFSPYFMQRVTQLSYKK